MARIDLGPRRGARLHLFATRASRVHVVRPTSCTTGSAAAAERVAGGLARCIPSLPAVTFRRFAHPATPRDVFASPGPRGQAKARRKTRTTRSMDRTHAAVRSTRNLVQEIPRWKREIRRRKTKVAAWVDIRRNRVSNETARIRSRACASRYKWKGQLIVRGDGKHLHIPWLRKTHVDPMHRRSFPSIPRPTIRCLESWPVPPPHHAAPRLFRTKKGIRFPFGTDLVHVHVGADESRTSRHPFACVARNAGVSEETRVWFAEIFK